MSATLRPLPIGIFAAFLGSIGLAVWGLPQLEWRSIVGVGLLALLAGGMTNWSP